MKVSFMTILEEAVAYMRGNAITWFWRCQHMARPKFGSVLLQHFHWHYRYVYNREEIGHLYLQGNKHATSTVQINLDVPCVVKKISVD